MGRPVGEVEELKISIERLRELLDGLVVRGLRACGPDQLVPMETFIEQLEQAGAGHVASLLAELKEKIEKDDRSSAKALLRAQTSLRLLERLLTLKVVRSQYELALAIQDGNSDGEVEVDLDDEEDEDA